MVHHSWLRRGVSLLSAGALCLTLAASLAPRAAAAPDASAPRARHAHGGKFMAALERLNLSEGQKARLRAIQARYRQELQELRRGGDWQATVARERMKALRQKMRAEMLAVLTPEQQRQLREERAKRRAARRARAEAEV
jgi:Spy/CpxP family protein refolding chaperone